MYPLEAATVNSSLELDKAPIRGELVVFRSRTTGERQGIVNNALLSTLYYHTPPPDITVLLLSE